MIGLGWRVQHSSAIVVAVAGPASSPTILHREDIVLFDDSLVEGPYHAAAARVGGRRGVEAEPFLGPARALIESADKNAATALSAAIRRLRSSLGPIGAVGVVGGNRKLPNELLEILASHARLHEAERDLYEHAIADSAARSKLPVTMIPAAGTLLADASQALAVDVASILGALGKSLAPPWQKQHKEATAAALVALHALE